MSAWTNVTLDRSSETHDRRQQALLQAEMEFWKREAERLRETLENIPEAVERYGYVTIARRNEETIKLIAAVADKEGAE